MNFEFEHKGEMFQVVVVQRTGCDFVPRVGLQVLYNDKHVYLRHEYVCDNPEVFSVKSLDDYCEIMEMQREWEDLDGELLKAAEYLNPPPSFKDKIDEYWENNPDLNRPTSRAIRLCSNDFENKFALAWADFVRFCERKKVSPYDVPKRMVMSKLLSYNHGLNKFSGKSLVAKIDKMFEEAEFGDIPWSM